VESLCLLFSLWSFFQNHVLLLLLHSPIVYLLYNNMSPFASQYITLHTILSEKMTRHIRHFTILETRSNILHFIGNPIHGMLCDTSLQCYDDMWLWQQDNTALFSRWLCLLCSIQVNAFIQFIHSQCCQISSYQISLHGPSIFSQILPFILLIQQCV